MKEFHLQLTIFLTKTNPNSVKTTLGLNIQGGNSVKSMLFYPGFVKHNPC